MWQIARKALMWPVLAVLIVGLAPLTSTEASPPAGRRIALSGYDPVAYFTAGEPQKGSDEFWYEFDDAVYLFKSADHLAKFTADPERYAPQYAGFCAGGISKGYKVEPDPQAWAIMNGKLFVFQFQDRVPMFKQDTSFVEKANANWPSLKTEPGR